VSRDTMPDVLLPVTIVFALLHVVAGLTSIGVGIVACRQSDVLRAQSLSPIWSGIFVSIHSVLYFVFSLVLYFLYSTQPSIPAG